MSQSGSLNNGSSSAGSVLEFTGGTGTSGTFPVAPNGFGQVSLSSADGSLAIVGSANAIDFSSGIYQVTGQITSAQIKTLNASPIQIIAAPGANKIIHILGFMSVFNYGGSNVFVAGVFQTVNLFYSTVSTGGTLIVNGVLTGTSTLWASQAPNLSLINLSTSVNQPINIYNSSTEISGNAANNNTITYSVLYRIVTLP